MTDVATHLLSTGDDLAYGGDLREGGFTQVLIELAARYTRGLKVFISYRHEDKDQVDQLRRVVNYFAWPVHIQMTNDQLDSLYKEVGDVAEIKLLDLEGEPMPMEIRKSIPASEPDDEAWSRGLTSMRQTMRGQTDARILLGVEWRVTRGSCQELLKKHYYRFNQASRYFFSVALVGAL